MHLNELFSLVYGEEGDRSTDKGRSRTKQRDLKHVKLRLPRHTGREFLMPATAAHHMAHG